ncbi:hypothetical protein NT6N_19470 [Oceaniferula spumae]|uniref:Type II secretion system protein GspG C-terminal domain-containing protein n=1 Tax=Oceaniferula spumae TaxID=2979115 RepID=A0AAT9FLC5_9BACT
MKMTHYRRANGFTLIEIITVISIIAVLATMTVGGFGYFKRVAAENRTRVLIAGVSRGLDEYRSDYGFFPSGNGEEGSSEQVYIALYGDGALAIDSNSHAVTIVAEPDGKPDEGQDVYMGVLNPELKGSQRNVELIDGYYAIVDAWGNEIRYQNPGEMNPGDDFDLWSYGPDLEGGPRGSEDYNADDITNW